MKRKLTSVELADLIKTPFSVFFFVYFCALTHIMAAHHFTVLVL